MLVETRWTILAIVTRYCALIRLTSSNAARLRQCYTVELSSRFTTKLQLKSHNVLITSSFWISGGQTTMHIEPLKRRCTFSNTQNGTFSWKHNVTRMWANAQRDSRPAEYRWRPLFNAAVWLTPITTVPCSNAAKTRNPLKLPGVLQTNETISVASGPTFTILWGHLEEILLLKKFFSDCR